MGIAGLPGIPGQGLLQEIQELEQEIRQLSQEINGNQQQPGQPSSKQGGSCDPLGSAIGGLGGDPLGGAPPSYSQAGAAPPPSSQIGAAPPPPDQAGGPSSSQAAAGTASPAGTQTALQQATDNYKSAAQGLAQNGVVLDSGGNIDTSNSINQGQPQAGAISKFNEAKAAYIQADQNAQSAINGGDASQASWVATQDENHQWNEATKNYPYNLTYAGQGN